MEIRTNDSATGPPSALRLVVIVGSTRTGRSGTKVARWFLRLTQHRADFTVDVVDVGRADPTGEVSARLAAADAFVVVAPEYNHSFPGPLKSMIDAHHVEWQAKPVGFVSYGGISGGLRAVEQLRLVFAELHTVTVRDTVSFHRVEEQFDADGEPLDDSTRTAAGKRLLDSIAWWGRALRDARALRPYS